jgi:SRSO17 transposase
VVQADGGYGDITGFRTGLEDRDLEYVVQVKGVTSAHPADAVHSSEAHRRPWTSGIPPAQPGSALG